MTRRKKYAIMMKTRCAKGENAVENLIPRWYRELELFRGVKPLLVLEGCVMDQVRVPVTGSVAEDTLLPLSAFLNAYLSDAGYEQVVFYSNLVGLMNPYAPEMLDNFAKTNQAEVVSGAIPAEFKGNDANTAPNIIRRAMMQGKHATAVVMEMASRYIVTPDRLDQMEVNSFNLLLQASLSAATVRTAQGKLPNLLILLVNKLNDLPAWFYLDNPVCKTITLEAPDRDERMRFLSGSAWPSFFDAAVYRTDMPYYQQHPDDLRKLREKFVGLTEGMSFTELDALRRMSRSQCAPIRDLCSIVDLYKYGIHENPWAKLSMESLKTAKADFQKRIKGQDTALERSLDVIKRAERREFLRHGQAQGRAVLRRADRHGQDRNRQGTRGKDFRRRIRLRSLRHERIRAEPFRPEAAWRTARLCRLRGGRPADQRREEAPVLHSAV